MSENRNKNEDDQERCNNDKREKSIMDRCKEERDKLTRNYSQIARKKFTEFSERCTELAEDAKTNLQEVASKNYIKYKTKLTETGKKCAKTAAKQCAETADKCKENLRTQKQIYAEHVKDTSDQCKEKCLEHFKDIKEKCSEHVTDFRENSSANVKDLWEKCSGRVTDLRDKCAERVTEINEKCRRLISEEVKETCVEKYNEFAKRVAGLPAQCKHVAQRSHEYVQNTYEGCKEGIKDTARNKCRECLDQMHEVRDNMIDSCRTGSRVLKSTCTDMVDRCKVDARGLADRYTDKARRMTFVTRKWGTSAGLYCTTALVLVTYMSDWKAVLQYLPLYNGKYRSDE